MPEPPHSARSLPQERALWNASECIMFLDMQLRAWGSGRRGRWRDRGARASLPIDIPHVPPVPPPPDP